MHTYKPRFGGMWIAACLIIVFSVLLAACGSQDIGLPPIIPAPSDTPEVEEPTIIPVERLYENSWVLVTYGDPANPTVLPSNTLVTAVFSEDGSLAGTSACNQYRTSFNA